MPNPDLPDIQASLRGDSTAFKRLIGRYQPVIGRRMWRFTRDRHRWEELVEDVFVEAFMSLKGYRGKAPFEHWLHRIATRVGYRFWKQQYRRRNHVSLTEAVDIAQDSDGGVQAVDNADWAEQFLGQLKPRDRLVLELLYLQELSVEQAAEWTGWSRTMVKVQAHRARKRLRDIVQKLQAGQGGARNSGEDDE